MAFILYLRPFNFQDLAKVFSPAEEFNIEFLLCPKHEVQWDYEVIDMRSGEESKPLQCLNRKAGIQKILEVLDKNKTYPQEYNLRLPEKLNVGIGTYSGDVIFNFEDKVEEQYLSKIIDQWHLMSGYKFEGLEKLEPDMLYDVTEARATAMHKPKNLDWLFEYLYNDLCQEGSNCIEKNTFLPNRERIYYSK